MERFANHINLVNKIEAVAKFIYVSLTALRRLGELILIFKINGNIDKSNNNRLKIIHNGQTFSR